MMNIFVVFVFFWKYKEQSTKVFLQNTLFVKYKKLPQTCIKRMLGDKNQYNFHNVTIYSTSQFLCGR